jgi:hypothetical protein
MLNVVGPSGVPGSALDAIDETLTGLELPMAPGDAYWVTSPGGDLFRVDVGESDVTVRLDSLTGSPRRAFDYASSVAERVAELAGGSVDLEPVTVEAEDQADGVWLRTRGLVRFGVPELEVYGIRPLEQAAAQAALRRVAAHLAGGGTIEPGRKLGFDDALLVAREGERNRDYWGGTVVLELVDVDADGDVRDRGRGRGRSGESG